MIESIVGRFRSNSKANPDLEWSEHLDGFSTFRARALPTDKDALAVLWHWIDVPVLLCLIGISSALLSFATKVVLGYDAFLKNYLLDLVYEELKWPVYCLYSVCMALFACFLSQLICKESVGGGLADMKTILGGVVKPVLLSRKLIVAKALGLWFSLMGGLSVGREGPFVHISGAIADQLMKLSPFVHIRRQDSKRLEILACACASGVSATFGNAFGGVLFSIEFTSSAYMVRTLPKAFLTSVVAMIAFLFLGVSDELSLFQDQTQSIYKLPEMGELFVFFLIGLGGGLLGILFVYLVEFVVIFRNMLLDSHKHGKEVVAVRRYLIVGTVTLLVSSAMYVELARVPHTGKGSFVMLQYLFGAEEMPPAVVAKLCLFAIYKFIATLFSVTLPLPVGLFTPTFVTGGLLGRILGEILKSAPGFNGYAPWEYALLGAAAFSTGVTRAISTSVIIFELACQPHLGLPISVVVLTAHFVGNRFSKNVYDVLMEANGGPYMDDLPAALYTVPVCNVMMPIVEHHVLSLDSTYKEAAELLDATEASHHGLDAHTSNGIYLDDTGAAHNNSAPSPTPGVDVLNRTTSLELDMETPERNHASSLYGGVELTHGATLNNPLHSQHSNTRGLLNSTSVEMEQLPLLGAQMYRVASGVLPEHNAQYEVRHRRAGQHASVRKYYAPTVIPVVQSKDSMVIVGAVLRKDLKESLSKLRKLAEVAYSAPVILGRYEDSKRSSGDKSKRQGQPSPAPPLQSSAQSRVYMNETVQFIIVTDEGRSIQPVVNAARLGSSDRDLYGGVSFHSLPLAIPLDPSPYQIVDSMHLSKVDMVFRLLSLNQAYVTNSGRVVGIVTRSLLRDYLGSNRKRPTDRCKKFCGNIYTSLFAKNSNAYTEIAEEEAT